MKKAHRKTAFYKILTAVFKNLTAVFLVKNSRHFLYYTCPNQLTL